MKKPLFDEKTFLGYEVKPRLFWVIFTLMMVFFTSPVAHLPFFLGFGPWAALVAGCLAVVFNVGIPLFFAHRARKPTTGEEDDTVLEFRPPRKS